MWLKSRSFSQPIIPGTPISVLWQEIFEEIDKDQICCAFINNENIVTRADYRLNL